MRYVAPGILFLWVTLMVPVLALAGVSEDIYWDESFVVHAPDRFTDAIVVVGTDMYVG
ncbi:MAG: hypothetical protein IH969_10720, partial [Candidatus Krumholzibacteriota bacterium]|nr:hypothetical protein [Candidatus Krumholzibacteriota bacterium]